MTIAQNAPQSVAETASDDGGRRKQWMRASVLRDYAVLISTVGLFIALALSSENFLTTTNLLNIIDQHTSLGIIACAGTLVIIAGGFDLSVGAMYAVGGVVAARLTDELGLAQGMIIGTLIGCVLGLSNGVAVASFRINPFIATLASGIIFSGVSLTVSDGTLISVENPDFILFGSRELFGVRLTTWIFAATAIIAWIILSRTTFGRYIYACGGNEEAARLSGIRVGQIRLAVFTLSGLAAALAGALFAARVGVGDSTAGASLTLTAVAAIVVGGNSIWGGEGAIWRTLVGLAFLALIGNGFNLLGVDAKYQNIVQGAIILLAAGADAYARRERR